MAAKIMFLTNRLGVELEMQYVSLENYISGWGCCLNTQLSHKSKNHNDINLAALNVLGC